MTDLQAITWFIITPLAYITLKIFLGIYKFIEKRISEKKEREAEEERERTKLERYLGTDISLVDSTLEFYYMTEEKVYEEPDGSSYIEEVSGPKNINMFSGRWYVHNEILYLEICDKKQAIKRQERRYSPESQWVRCDEVTFMESNHQWLAEHEIIEMNSCG